MKIMDYLMIGATIRIGQEMLCLPYSGFLPKRSLMVPNYYFDIQMNKVSPGDIFLIYVY